MVSTSPQCDAHLKPFIQIIITTIIINVLPNITIIIKYGYFKWSTLDGAINVKKRWKHIFLVILAVNGLWSRLLPF